MPTRKQQHPIFPWLQETPGAVGQYYDHWERKKNKTYQHRPEFGVATPDAVAYLASQGLGEPVGMHDRGDLEPRDHWVLRWPHAEPFTLRLHGSAIYRARDMQKLVTVAIGVPAWQQAEDIRRGNVDRAIERYGSRNLPLAQAIRHYERAAWVLGAPIEPTGTFWVQPRSMVQRLAHALELPQVGVLEALGQYCGEMRAIQFIDHSDSGMSPPRAAYLLAFYGCPDLPLEELRAQAVDQATIWGLVRCANGGIALVAQVPVQP